MMSRVSRGLLVVLLAVVIGCVSGCVRMSIDLAAAPDGSTTGRIVAGVDASLAQGQESKSPFTELTQSGSNWKSREYREGNWLMTEATGSAPAGQALFPVDEEGDAPQSKLAASAHRLSTWYTMTLEMPPMAQEMAKPPTDMDAQTEALVKGMMGSFEISFSLQAPGRVVATTGKVVAPGKAEWHMGFEELGSKKLPDFRVVTELPNWSNIGRLSDQLAYTGRLYEAAPKLAAALQRGLLPNPPINASEKLAAEDYARLLEIADKLDTAGRPGVTESVMGKLRLNTDETTAAAIAAAHARVMKMDVNALSYRAISGALLSELK